MWTLHKAWVFISVVLNTIRTHYRTAVFMFTAKKFGHDLQSTDDLLGFLTRVDARLLTEATISDLYVPGAARKEVTLMWGPIVEGYY